MVGCKWYPSKVEDEIYGIMEADEIGIDLYNEYVIDAITDYFTNYSGIEEWNLGSSLWPNESGGVCFVSWIEDGHIHMIGFDFIKNGFVCD